MHLVRIARPTETSVSVATVKANERVSHTSEDDLIAGFIKAAEDLIERRCNRSIMRQKFRLVVPTILSTVTLFRPPMEGEITVTAASLTRDGETTALDHEVAVMGISSMLPTATFDAGTPGRGMMTIEYETGAATAGDVPPGIAHAVLLLASHYYKSREAAATDIRMKAADKTLPYGVESFVGAYRIPNVNIAVNEARNGTATEY